MKRFFGIIAALSLGLSALVGVQPATAGTNCLTVRQEVVASALSSGDISLASKATNMCSSCASIGSFYQTTNLSPYLDSRVLAAYTSCLADVSGGNNNGGNNNGGGVPGCGSKIFTKVGTPSIVGTLKSGYLLKAKTTAWSPSPSNLVYDWYRNGKKILAGSDTIILDSTDLGTKYVLKVTASLTCYKSKTVSSATSKTIMKNSLPKLKASQVKILVGQHCVGMCDEDSTTLELSSSLGDFWYDQEPVWTMVGNRTWSAENQGNGLVYLPTLSFSDDYGNEYSICQNGTKYAVRVTMTAGILGKYDATKITIPTKQYVCISNSNRYTPNF